MNVSLTRRLRTLVEERVRSGRYQSASEVVREALRLLEDVEELQELRLQALREEVAAGLRDLDHGRSAVFDRKLLKSVRSRGRKKLARSRG
jgi:antitoxin ParD1/3/4